VDGIEFMLKSKAQDVVYVTVRALRAGECGMFEQGFEIALAENGVEHR
jgi:hypothetical protein